MASPISLLLKGNVRKAVFFVHLWFGLFVGLYFAVIGVTGSFLVYKEDYEARLVMPERNFVAPPTPNATPMPLADILAGLRKKLPNATDEQLAFINPPATANGAYLMRLPDDGRSKPTTIDPYTGRVIKLYDGSNPLLTWIDDLHVELLKGAQGRLVNGYAGLLAGLLLLTGIWLWWPATLKQIKIRSTIKKGAPSHRVIADLHNILGIYSVLLLLVVTVTGSMIIFYAPIQSMVMKRLGSARVAQLPRLTPTPGAKRLSIDRLMAISEGIAPHAHYVFVLYPTAPNQLFYAYRRSEIGILPDTRIYLNPYSGKVMQVGRETTDPATRRVMRSASGIHFGRWGSGWSKALYFVLGFIPLGLFITGVLMYIRSRKSKIASRKRRVGATAPSAS